jgi:hypothetical protein
MAHRHPTILTAIALTLGLGFGMSAVIHAQAAKKKLYCWNENGRRICSDALPANAANAARTEISARSGLATGEVARALNDSERVAAAAAADAARRQAETTALQQRRDLAMVESYMTEADLRRAYGERTTLLDESVKASKLGMTNQRLSLITLLRQAGDWELDKKPVPKKLANSILQQHNDLIHQQQILASQLQDRATLGAELDDAVRRYRELKASQTATPPPKPADAPSPGAG